MPTQAATEYSRHETGTLICGNTSLVVKTSYLVNLDYPGDQVLKQTVTLINTKTGEQKDLKTDGRYVTKHMPEEREVLDAAISVFACIKSKLGKYFFRLDYYCTSGEEQGICERGKVTWDRFFHEDGTMLFPSPRHWKIKPAEHALYKRLGLLDKANVIALKDVTE